ncbi:unnamed protein product [Gongylonema pulchrum]|uniref:H15 domain-containing protein n=1 Tax=Gongylonema pulchrum TaxID=637853 RepID=A0A183EZX9_9BILA|nr:unnamed protein product [Gongylonema pulchrum]
MVQHKKKNKVQIPQGVKPKSKRKGKKAKKRPVQHAGKSTSTSVAAKVTRTINRRNEELIRNRAAQDTGNSTATDCSK